jgi:hypothetical protein
MHLQQEYSTHLTSTTDEMATQQPAANAMSIEAGQLEAQNEQQVLRLKGGGNTFADCLA